jgi:lysophospholipase L1-like esterase
MNRKTLVILSDSLARARRKRPETITFPETYAGRLMSRLDEWNVVLNARTAQNTTTLLGVGEIEFLEGFVADAIVLHLGINDCAPRALSVRERAWLERARVPFTTWALLPALQPFLRKHHYRLTRRRLVCDVPPDQFARNLPRIRESFAAHRHLFIPILPPSKQYCEHSCAIAEQVERYNDMLRQAGFEEVALPDAFDPARHVGTDMIHPNSEGHRLIAEAIERQIVTSSDAALPGPAHA